MINVSKTYLPPLEEYVKYLQGIWDRNLVANGGPLVLELEEKLRTILGVKHLFFLSSGTFALQIAIKTLDRVGEIITTPFSYVATTSSIVWQGCTPVFVDINPQTLNIDEEKIEASITDKTLAILPVHVFGNPCNIEKIRQIAKKHHLKVIYDAAHAFGVRYESKAVATYGDISIFSFHAAKTFHTIEGGAIVTNDDELAHKISYMRNFGHKGIHKDFWGLGINGKNSELHAAMGLCVLPKVLELVARNRYLTELYEDFVKRCQKLNPKISVFNYAYFPVLFNSEDDLIVALNTMQKNDIFPRRYFYPSLNTLNYVKRVSMPIAEDISRRVLCLPLYSSLTEKDIAKIVNCLP